jgi:hypothetical protein
MDKTIEKETAEFDQREAVVLVVGCIGALALTYVAGYNDGWKDGHRKRKKRAKAK